jgi:hypothetical protein
MVPEDLLTREIREAILQSPTRHPKIAIEEVAGRRGMAKQNDWMYRLHAHDNETHPPY